MPEGDQGQQDLCRTAASRTVCSAPSRPLAFDGSKVIAAQHSRPPTSASATPLPGKPTCPSRVTSRSADGEASRGVDLLQELLREALADVPDARADEHQPGGTDQELAARPAEDAGRGVLLLLRSWTGRCRWRT